MKQQEKVKIAIHSLIDLITNSSTEIFVDCTNSVQPAKDLLQELLELNGSDKKVDEVFDVTLEEDYNNLSDYIEYYLEEDEAYDTIIENYKINEGEYSDREKEIDKLIKDYQAGKVDLNIDSYHVQKHLVVTSKDEKYNHLLKLLNKFLNSPKHYEYSNG